MSVRPPDLSSLGLVTEGAPGSWAVFSQDRAYRYMLARTWDPYDQGDSLFADPVRPLMVFVMLNPSTADAFKPDPTITRCLGFAKRERCGGILVVNLCGYRATDPKALLKVADPVGPHNEELVQRALRNPLMAIGVAAWGAISPRVRQRASGIIVAAKCSRSLWCLGKTKAGEPRHPLMLAASAPLERLADGKPW